MTSIFTVNLKYRLTAQSNVMLRLRCSGICIACQYLTKLEIYEKFGGFVCKPPGYTLTVCYREQPSRQAEEEVRRRNHHHQQQQQQQPVNAVTAHHL